ncbi:MAG: hypothetical protein PVJ57_19065 [Phycisphaerae bacterium]|jgi:hypothetical protein
MGLLGFWNGDSDSFHLAFRLATALVWWLFIAASVVLIIREVIWRRRMRRLGELEDLLSHVATAPNKEAEQNALRELARWAASARIVLSVCAYQRSDGMKVPVSGVQDRDGCDMGFEVRFDLDRDRTPERAYQLCLKAPGQIRLLAAE